MTRYCYNPTHLLTWASNRCLVLSKGHLYIFLQLLKIELLLLQQLILLELSLDKRFANFYLFGPMLIVTQCLRFHFIYQIGKYLFRSRYYVTFSYCAKAFKYFYFSMQFEYANEYVNEYALLTHGGYIREL